MEYYEAISTISLVEKSITHPIFDTSKKVKKRIKLFSEFCEMFEQSANFFSN